MKLYELEGHKLSNMLKSKEITALELTENIIKRIKETDNDIESYISTREEFAINEAKSIDEKINKGEELPILAGIPISLKDNIIINGEKTTAGSKMLENYIGIYESTTVKKIKESSMIILGKTNMDEFAMGSSTETSAFKKTKNPWDISKVPGGSSGGSAASVAIGSSILSIASDTSGSIRQPAAFCGVVGLKPTNGLVSRYGLVATVSSLDQIGPITKDVRDSALSLNVISGYDEMDAKSIKQDKIDYTSYLNENIKGMKIGLPIEYLENDSLDKGIKKHILNAVENYKNLGAEVIEVSLPHTKYATSVYNILGTSEISANLSRYDGVRYGYRSKNYNNLEELYVKSRTESFGNEVKLRILLGTHFLSTGSYEKYYKRALAIQKIITKDFIDVFKNVDVLLTPTTPTTAFNFNEKIDDVVKMYSSDMYTTAASLAKLPALTIPIGLEEGLPVGMQLIGNHFNEGKILKTAYSYEKVRGEFKLNK
ncbi:MAG: Asp-tRNA(Asn)/Glu-tRNA(Gln) amidotransferase subunit GatA [Fusobacteria bacterium]|nr:Asp-tRNA(Asn)/Glu-tRNA(Gln) amidotransferase subunit GatA [Fusobacteriota bacterium]